MSGSLVMPLLRNEIFFHAVNRIEVEKKSTRSSQFSRAKNRSVKMADVAVYSDRFRAFLTLAVTIYSFRKVVIRKLYLIVSFSRFDI